MPANIIIGSAPAELIDRISVSAGYVEPDSGVALQIASDIFSHVGGKLNGSIPANDGGRFPANIIVNIAVDYTVESGLTNISQSLTVPVGTAGALLNWEVPNKSPAITRIHFGFVMNRIDTIDFQWELLAAGSVVKSGLQTLKAVGGMPFDGKPNPNRIEVSLYSQPGVINQFRLWSDSRRLNSRDLAPFDLTKVLQTSSIELSFLFIDEIHGKLTASIT